MRHKKILMRYVAQILWICLYMIAVAAPGAAAAAERSGAGPSPDAQSVEISFFWEPGCRFCQRAKQFLATIGPSERAWLVIRDYDVSRSPAGQELFARANTHFGISNPGIPLIIVGRQPFLGFDTAETTGQLVLEAARACHRNDCPGLAALLGGSEGEITGEQPAAAPSALPETIDLPIFGTLDLQALSLPALTVLLAAIDGFNPCAMWVLVFLIGLLLGMQDRLRMWLLGGAFLLTSGIVYFGFLAAWLNLFLLLGTIFWVRLAVGAVALGSGLHYMREFARNAAAECQVTNPQQRRRIMDAFRASVTEKRFLVAVAGIVGLAVAVNTIELLCSAGIPAVYTKVLAMSALPGWQHYALLVLYVIVFMLDDAAIFVLAMMTLAATGMTSRYLRVSHLAGGVVMLTIGILLMIAPGWLNFAP